MIIQKRECYLVDDGTLDTVISIDGVEHRFDMEYAAQYRDENGAMTTEGFEDLCREVIDNEEIQTEMYGGGGLEDE
ncbi:MAG: hypothetical protein ACW99A_13315 [Candidatus Kariarchaeaceae archaeon]|jgi:hypothetical protein